jgi:hypothetical protein
MRWQLLLAAYLSGAGLTYGHVYHEQYALAQRSWKNLDEMTWQNWAGMQATPAATLWPLYWTGALGEMVTR